MRHIFPISLIVLASGCLPNFATVDEACDGKVPGSKQVTNKDAVDVFARINCYRRLAKEARANMDPQVQEAVENHNNYQQQNFVEADWPSNLGTEASGMPGFTGADPYARLEETGYANVNRGTLGLWQYIYWDSEDPVSRIDFWFHDPQARESFLQLAWVAGGYAEGKLQNIDEASGLSPNMAYMNIFYSIPVRDHAGTPVFYPKDGQEEVPTGFEGVDPDNPMTGKGLIGYPITVTVGSDEPGGGSNPHGITIGKSSLTGPGGSVEMEVYTPETDPWMRYQAAFYPLEPFQPNSEYTLDVEMEWNGQDDRSFSVTFTTGKEDVPHSSQAFGRELPRKPLITHQIIEYPITGP